MGLFSKAAKPDPKIVVEGIGITFSRQSGHDIWEFTYRGTEFCSFGPELKFPAKAELDGILSIVEALKPEMVSRLKKEVKTDDGESYMVNIEEFAANKSFEVSWSDGESWADMGAEFTIKDKRIVDESWGD